MFKQVELKYNYNALEPHIDELTMITHYTKHHAAYTANLNVASEFKDYSIEDIFINLSTISDEALRTTIRNNGGGFYNHNLYFDTMSPNGGGQPSGDLANQIEKKFGDFNTLKDQLSNAAATRFGSGWAWLSANKDGELKVSSSPNQDNPIIETQGEWTPILGIDVWEHAYYLNYKNLRGDYVNAFFNVIDWNEVAKNYTKIKNI